MADHQEAGTPITVENAWPFTSVTHAFLEGRSAAVVVGSDLRVWDLDDRQLIRHVTLPYFPPEKDFKHGLRDVACTRVNGRVVAVTGGYDKTVRIVDLLAGAQVGDPLTGHTSTIWAVACGSLHGTPIALTAGDDTTVGLWDLRQRQPIGRPLTGHTKAVRSVAWGRVDGRSVAISSDRDTVLVWDLEASPPMPRPLEDLGGEVRAVALTAVGGRPVAVTGGEDVRLWDPLTGRPVGPPLFDGRDTFVSSLACGTLHGRPTVLAAIYGQHVRVWDLEEHRRIGPTPPGRYADEVPAHWTDPATGDVYDLTGDLVDDDGDRWKVVDYDGIEPIVCELPNDPTVAFGIVDAHQEFGLSSVITPGRHR
ncbi:WD40 repeat domain-containing protein [Streptomyces anulatus]|uniref:WD40 repeat domain-containing protein n=1 Tax=Streptomyces anulatus TaxID=1892 RepID=UPI00386E90AE